jgi:hypothetical protein
METDANSLELFYDISLFFCDMQKNNIVIETILIEMWNLLWEKNVTKLCKLKKYIFKNKEKPTIFLSFTTCKRFDLFTKTINSILNHWLDIDKIDYWFCVDDNSSEIDRENMKKLYGWIDYYLKTPEEKGHLISMNIIWNKLKVLKPTYWIHMEDDFVFFDKMNYIEKSIQGLHTLKDKNVKQILFNINYGETIQGYNSRGHIFTENDFALHQYKEGNFSYMNCHYWPHYSFRPSLTEVETILKLGDFHSEDTFFERAYANKWLNTGYQSAFFNKLTNIHIGRLTSERFDDNKLNAYKLNNEDQFFKSPLININEDKMDNKNDENIDNKKENIHLIIKEKE